ncbi:MAG: condensation domain-containing protein, partial [Tistlia sp.]
PVEGPSGALYGAGAERLHLLELIAVVTEGHLRLDLRYSPTRHREATARRLLEETAARLRALLAWALDPAQGGLLPSDVPLAGLDRARLGRLLERIGARAGRHPARAIETILPLSPQQQGMLFDSLAAAGSGVHHEQLEIRLKGRLDPAALRAAWRGVVARHAILRTGLFWDGLPQPLQVVFRQPPPSWVERQGAPDVARLQQDRLADLDLQRPEAFRLALWRVDAEDWRLVWTFHHLLLDGWSMALLLREVMILYAAECRGRAERLPAALPYGAYVAWLAERDQSESLAFWRAELAAAPRLPPLTFAGGDAAIQGDPYGERRLDLKVGRRGELEASARR